MRTTKRAGQFKRDYRRVKAAPRYRDVDARLATITGLLARDDPLPERYQDHPLSGDWQGYRDCHVWPDFERPLAISVVAALATARQAAACP